MSKNALQTYQKLLSFVNTNKLKIETFKQDIQSHDKNLDRYICSNNAIFKQDVKYLLSNFDFFLVYLEAVVQGVNFMISNESKPVSESDIKFKIGQYAINNSYIPNSRPHFGLKFYYSEKDSISSVFDYPYLDTSFRSLGKYDRLGSERSDIDYIFSEIENTLDVSTAFLSAWNKTFERLLCERSFKMEHSISNDRLMFLGVFGATEFFGSAEFIEIEGVPQFRCFIKRKFVKRSDNGEYFYESVQDVQIANGSSLRQHFRVGGVVDYYKPIILEFIETLHPEILLTDEYSAIF